MGKQLTCIYRVWVDSLTNNKHWHHHLYSEYIVHQLQYRIAKSQIKRSRITKIGIVESALCPVDLKHKLQPMFYSQTTRNSHRPSPNGAFHFPDGTTNMTDHIESWRIRRIQLRKECSFLKRILQNISDYFTWRLCPTVMKPVRYNEIKVSWERACHCYLLTKLSICDKVNDQTFRRHQHPTTCLT